MLVISKVRECQTLDDPASVRLSTDSKTKQNKTDNNTKLSSSLGFKDSVETSILFACIFKCTYLRSDCTCLLFSPYMVATDI